MDDMQELLQELLDKIEEHYNDRFSTEAYKSYLIRLRTAAKEVMEYRA